MDTFLSSIPCWILVTILVFMSLHRSEAFTWTKEPDKPTVVVEDGVNNKNVGLFWSFRLEPNEDLVLLVFFRQRPGQVSATRIASRTKNTAFGFPKDSDFHKHYLPRMDSELVLLDVNDEDDEYIYSLQVSYSTGSDTPVETSQVAVIVRVPPKITKPEALKFWNPRFEVRKNATLTCNASGDPLPNITWTREGFRPDQFNASGYVLHFVNVEQKDIGSYKCTASNGYGKNATKLANVNINCDGQCEPQTVGITIDRKWNNEFGKLGSPEYNELATNLISAIVSLYSQPKNQDKQLYEAALDRPPSEGSIKTAIQLQFSRGVSDPLQPLREQVKTGQLGIYKVNKTLVLNPTDPLTSSPTGETTTASKQPPSVGARSGLTDAEMWGIIGACIAFAIVIIIIIIVCCIKKRQKQGGAVKSKYTEADGYRMNRQPPPSGLGTASPAYVEARMYAPANATKKQDDQQKPLNYADLAFDKSGKPPPRYGSGTEYSEMSPEKRPPPAGGQGGGGQGEGGFELWC